MEAAIITDTHWGVRSDSKQFLEFFDKFYTNIFFPYLKENNIKTIFHLGDIVDRRKFINYVTLSEFKRIFVQPCVDLGIELHVIVGNHDIPFRNTNHINAMNELFEKENINIYSEPADIKFDGVDITMMPWIQNTNYKQCMDHIENTKSQILFGHLELSGFVMHLGMTAHGGMDTKPFEKFDMVCSGHFHHKSSKGNIHYLGNPYEMTWSDYNDQRGFHIFNSEKRDLTFIQNPYRMFNKIWYDDVDTDLDTIVGNIDFESYKDTYVKVIVQNKKNPYWFDMILDGLYKVNPIDISIVEDNKHMDQQSDEEIFNEAEDTLASLYKFVDGMETPVDKKKLNQLFSNLYTEALTMEV
jgi:DNA repair exonuclease SbcCD nuclease subunit